MLLIKNGRVMDPGTKKDEIADILIEEGVISKIENNIEIKGIEVIDANGMIVCPGLIDAHVHFRDPGLTYKEDILTGSRSAARGGFTTVVCMANTNPVVDNEETLKYVLDKVGKSNINIVQTAAVTKGLKGEELVDMELLKKLGAKGFTDDGFPIMDSSLVLKSMEIAKNLDVPISFHEEDPSLIESSGINKGAPSVAEDILVARDCILAIKTGAKINIQHVSSATSVDLIRFAKSKGAKIYGEVTPHHFTLTETDVLKYGTNAKMNPPLRTEYDRLKLIEGLKDGTIDIIATDHAPHSKEEKNREFLNAPSGIIGLETALSLGVTYLVKEGHLTLLELLEKMTINPANLYKLETGRINKHLKADLLIFNENERWTVDKFFSKSNNSPFLGWKLFGKVKYTICNGEIVYQDK